MKMSQFDQRDLETVMVPMVPMNERRAALERLLEAAWHRGWDDCTEATIDTLSDRYSVDELVTIANQSGIEVERA